MRAFGALRAGVALLLCGSLCACGLDTGLGGAKNTFARGLAYVSGGDIWVADASDFEVAAFQLTADTGNSLPALTADGATVAFVHTDAAGTTAEVRTLPSAGGAAVTLLAPSSRQVAGLAWSPDGSALYVAADHAISQVSVADGSAVQVSPAGVDLSSPSVSADGALYALDRAGGTFDLLANGQATAAFSAPGAVRGAVSPRGDAVVYEDGSTHEIFVVDGAGARQLTAIAGAQESQPCWSTDGTQIFFASNAGGALKIYSLPASATRSTGATLIQVGSQPSFGGEGAAPRSGHERNRRPGLRPVGGRVGPEVPRQLGLLHAGSSLGRNVNPRVTARARPPAPRSRRG